MQTSSDDATGAAGVAAGIDQRDAEERQLRIEIMRDVREFVATQLASMRRNEETRQKFEAEAERAGTVPLPGLQYAKLRYDDVAVIRIVAQIAATLSVPGVAEEKAAARAWKLYRAIESAVPSADVPELAEVPQ